MLWCTTIGQTCDHIFDCHSAQSHKRFPKRLLKISWKLNGHKNPPALTLTMRLRSDEKMMMRKCGFQWWLWWKSCANKLCTLNKGFSPSFRLNGTKKSAKKWQIITRQVVLCAQYSLLCFMQKSYKQKLKKWQIKRGTTKTLLYA